MRLPPTLLLLLLSLLTNLVPTLAARTSATSFCKCVCFTNSTIIALNPPTDTTSRSSLKFSRSIPALHPRDSPSDDSSPSSDEKQPHHHKPTCADCNRAFCLNQGLKICENAKEEDVFATCFQRDSLKDELVVIFFIACTGALLLWALIKPWLQKARDTSTAYAPLSFGRGRNSAGGVSGGGGGGGGGGNGDVLPSTARRRGGGGPEAAGRGNSYSVDEEDEPDDDEPVLQSQR